MAKETSKIGEALNELNSRYGSGTIMRMGEKPNEKPEVFSTGCIALDEAVGIGGLPRGRIIEIYGAESSGKTTCALQVVASAQKKGGMAAYIDSEFALDPEYAKNLGINIDEMLVSQPSSAEEALEIVETLVRSNEVAIIVVDSVAAMVPQAEINGEMGDSNMGIMARLMSQAMRKLTSIVSQSNTCLVFINQTRSKIGVVYGSPVTTTGGNALKFYASIRLDIARTGPIKDGEEIVGNKTRVKVVKNKCSPPFKTCEFDIIFGKGISNEGSVIDSALKNNILVQKGAWFSYNGTNIAQGRANLRELLENNKDLYEEIVNAIPGK